MENSGECPQLDPLTLRPAVAGDAEFLESVYVSTREEEMAAWGWPPEQQRAFLKMQFDARNRSYQAAFEHAQHSVLLVAGAPAGTLIVDRVGNEIRLVDIALLPRYRSRGLGTRVISGLIEESSRKGVPLRLSVLHGNRAIRLYQRLGFVVVESDAMYIEMECRPQPKG